MLVSLGNVACSVPELVGRLSTLEVGPFHCRETAADIKSVATRATCVVSVTSRVQWTVLLSFLSSDMVVRSRSS